MNISNPIRSFFSRMRADARMDPVRDWLILLTLSIFAFAGIIVWNVWAFDTVARGGVIGAAATSTTPVFNSSSLDAVHSVFKMRSAEETKYVNGTYRFADPSQ